MAPKKQPNAPRTNDEALTPVATYSARGNQTIVRKSNDLIQNAMYSLTLSQQKLMLHIFAMIKPCLLYTSSVCGTGTLNIHTAFLASLPAGLRYYISLDHYQNQHLAPTF